MYNIFEVYVHIYLYLNHKSYLVSIVLPISYCPATWDLTNIGNAGCWECSSKTGIFIFIYCSSQKHCDLLPSSSW
ncbi:mCG147923, partial [Mus musculus]